MNQTGVKGSFALKVQLLPRFIDQVLVLSRLAEIQTPEGAFTTLSVSELFEHLRLPAPSNISALLSSLRDRRMIIRRSEKSSWSLTPLGRNTAEDLIGQLDPHRIEVELVHSLGSVFGQARHLVIPPMFAPPRWGRGIASLLEQYPFETNVFLMTRYPSNGHVAFLDPIAEVIATIRTELENHGLVMHMAADRQTEDDLLSNVTAHMWSCRYGIGLLEDRVERGMNDNVILELGAMLMTGRRCALLKDESLNRMDIPSDLVGHIYKSVDFNDQADVRNAVTSWVTEDLGLAAGGDGG